jgi:hypothetical protein
MLLAPLPSPIYTVISSYLFFFWKEEEEESSCEQKTVGKKEKREQRIERKNRENQEEAEDRRTGGDYLESILPCRTGACKDSMRFLKSSQRQKRGRLALVIRGN